ncbi:hypothetical protein ACH5AJ_36590 [Streptomyces rochei]|uniref:hypothetical protein n=1 Tax=Streptomyces rochei TaxID=1928 RepID=UPI0037B372F2
MTTTATAADRTLQLIADTLTATEAPMPDQPRTDDRIPLRTELSTAGQLAQALEANRQLHVRLGRAESETQAMMRDRNAALAERDQARATVATVEREHHESLATLSAVWAALNHGGYSHPTATAAELVEQAVTDRDNARETGDFRAAAIRANLAELRAAGQVITAVRTGTLEDIERALAAYDAGTEPTPPDNPATLRAAARHLRLLVDNRDRIWRPAPDGTYHRHPFGRRTRNTLDRQYGPTQTAMLIWLDGQDDEHAHTYGMACPVTCCRWPMEPSSLREQEAQAPGSGPARVQGSPDPRHVARLDRTGWVWFPDGNGRWRGAGTCHLNVSTETLERLHGPTVEAVVVPATAPEPIRPADWEQRAIDSITDAWSLVEDDAAVSAQRLAEIAVRAVIDAGLVGPGGRCAGCGQTYPRTPRAEVSLCWTCATEDQTGLDEPATTPTVGEYHWGRAWSPTQDEATCPCPKAPCGYVVRTAESTGCELHGPSETMRGGHFAASCPANTAREG